jgi:peptidoglycan hydrolase CwlO-like protein
MWIMDERKKQIEELEKNKRESQADLNALLERFGESLLGRAGADAAVEESGTVTGEYHRLRKEIADSEADIRAVEEQVRRLRELEERIEAKEREDSAHAKDLSGLRGRLGKLLLDDDTGAYADFTRPFREQAEALILKIHSLDGRVGELEQKEGNNVFAWIGKSAQGLVLRSFLAKAQDNLEQLYRSAGERYNRRDNARTDIQESRELAELGTLIEQVQAQARERSRELAELRDERRKIGDEFGAEGGPLKQTQNLRNHIGQAREELKILYRRFGAEASESGGMRERSPFIESLVCAEDQALLEDIARIERQIRDHERTTEKLRASLAVDEEQAKIEKCRRSIEDRKVRIAEAEKEIAGFEENIADSKKYIEELQKLL